MENKNRYALFFVVAVCMVNLQTELTYNMERLSQFVEGTVDPIFFNRVLTRWILRTISSYPTWLSLESANFFLQTIFLFTALIFIYKTGKHLLSENHGIGAALICAATLPWGFLRTGFSTSYPYDLSSLLVISLGLYAITKRSNPLFYAVLLIGTLNKETTLWLIPAYVFNYRQKLKVDLQAVGQFTFLCLLYGVSYFGVRCVHFSPFSAELPIQLFSAHQNSESRLFLNLAQFYSPFKGVISEWLYLPLLLHVLPLREFRRLPQFLQRCYWAAPFYLIPIFIVGNVNEYRLFNEIIPLTSLSLAASLLSGYRKESPASEKRVGQGE